MGRSAFPPTPPPEERGPSRGMSVRSGVSRGPPARLNLDTQLASRKYEKAISPQDSAASANSARPTRSASSANAPSRGFSVRDNQQPPLQRRPTRPIQEDPYDEVYGDRNNRGYGRRSGESRERSRQTSRRRQPQQYISEEDLASDYEDGSFDGDNFEMVGGPRRRAGSSSMSSSRNASRRPTEVSKFRVKVHYEDVRNIMIGSSVEFQDFYDKIGSKFGLRRRFKIKIKDEDMPEGDMITMGDQDDLDMAISSARDAAKRDRMDTGRIEVSLPLTMFRVISIANFCSRFGSSMHRLVFSRFPFCVCFFVPYITYTLHSSRPLRRHVGSVFLCQQSLSSWSFFLVVLYSISLPAARAGVDLRFTRLFYIFFIFTT